MVLLLIQIFFICVIMIGAVAWALSHRYRRRKTLQERVGRYKSIFGDINWTSVAGGNFLHKGTEVSVRYVDFESASTKIHIRKDEIAFYVKCQTQLACHSLFPPNLNFFRVFNTLIRFFENSQRFEVQRSGISIRSLELDRSDKILRRTLDTPVVSDLLQKAYTLGCRYFSIAEGSLLISIPAQRFFASHHKQVIDQICELLLELRSEVAHDYQRVENA